MTQQDIVNAVNRLTVGYNISWQDIKYDADKAILKINSYLGAKYPKMSEVLTGPDTTYTIKQHGKDIPIFPEQYIHTIVIPFIASEILARDEEFTTIYNKYLLEIEDGLYLMFSNEYNRIPYSFQQHDTTGVFFSETTMSGNYAYGSHSNNVYEQHHEHKHEDHHKVPDFTFDVTYLVNNPNVMVNDAWVVDNTKYKYKGTYKVTPPLPKVYYNATGTKKYTLVAWSTDVQGVNRITNFEEEHIITSDVYLYGVWEEESTLTMDFVNAQDDVLTHYVPRLTDLNVEYLVIPRYINGQMVIRITSNLLPIGNKVNKIILPDTIKTIESGAFTNFTGDEIVFPKEGSNITIDSNALDLFNSKLDTNENTNKPLIIPSSITTMNITAFGATLLNISDHTIIRHIDVICLRSGNTTTFTLPDGLIYMPNSVDQCICYHIHYVGDR